MKDRLVDLDAVFGPVPAEPKWLGSLELVPVARERCMLCGGATMRQTIAQPALFYHGGYGATRVTTFVLCLGCPGVRLSSVDEVNPRRAA